MCIVIDANTLTCVFNNENIDHSNFVPVYDWIITGKGKMVIGGSHYGEELNQVRYLIPFIAQLIKANKVKVLDKQSVDDKEAEILGLVTGRDFDDPHIIAIVVIGGIRLVCTNEKRAIPFFTNKCFYSKGKAPKIYTSRRNTNLLTNKYCINCRVDCRKLNKNKYTKLKSYKQG